jgi:hypothetical protein
LTLPVLRVEGFIGASPCIPPPLGAAAAIALVTIPGATKLPILPIRLTEGSIKPEVGLKRPRPLRPKGIYPLSEGMKSLMTFNPRKVSPPQVIYFPKRGFLKALPTNCPCNTAAMAVTT